MAPFTGTHVHTHATQPRALTSTRQCWPLQGKEQMEWLGWAQG